MTRHILVVTYYYPPDSSVGSNRWTSLTCHLRSLGHEVTVLTTSAFGTLPDDDGQVIRTADLRTSVVLRRSLRRPALTAPDVRKRGAPTPPRILTDGLVPDAFALTWVPFALAATRKALRARTYDCLVTCSGVLSAQLVGLLLGRTRPAWIADFEDGWRFEPLRGPWPTGAQDRLDAYLESQVGRTAERITAVARPMVADFNARFGDRAELVPMAWDPNLARAVDDLHTPQVNAGRINIVYTGGFDLFSRRDPRGFIAALRLLIERHPEDADRLSVLIAGVVSPAGERMLDEIDRPGLIQRLGVLPQHEAIALQRRADALLLIATGDQTSTVSGKIYEYLAAGCPIVAIVAENEAAHLIRATRTGVVLAPDDVEGIAAALRDVARGRLRDTYRPIDLERYRYPRPAEAFIDTVEHAIAAHRGAENPR